MKRYLILVILFFSVVHNLKSQNEDLSSSRFEITLMPYSLLDYNPRLRMGFEYYSSDKFGYSFDFGYGNSSFDRLLDRGNWGDNYDFSPINDNIRNAYKGTSNIKGGVEFRLRSVFLLRFQCSKLNRG